MFAEGHTLEWFERFYQYQIKSRIDRPRSCKDPSLNSQDLVMEGDLATWQKCRITEAKEKDDASYLLAVEGKAAIPPEAERNAQADPTSKNSRPLPLPSPSRQLGNPAPNLLLQGPPGIYEHKTPN